MVKLLSFSIVYKLLNLCTFHKLSPLWPFCVSQNSVQIWSTGMLFSLTVSLFLVFTVLNNRNRNKLLLALVKCFQSKKFNSKYLYMVITQKDLVIMCLQLWQIQRTREIHKLNIEQSVLLKQRKVTKLANQKLIVIARVQ